MERFAHWLSRQVHRCELRWHRAVTRVQLARRERDGVANVVVERRGYTFGGISFLRRRLRRDQHPPLDADEDADDDR